MRKSIPAILALAATSFASPLSAEVIAADNSSFITRAEAVVEADTKAAWLALISPARWWSGEHTWSADAANLTLVPQAGGCFCERIPEVEDAERITLEGSVEHMRVIQAYPEVALRMNGALGPLQSEPVTGILTIALSEVEDGTKIVFEYNVGGSMRYPVPVISAAVDGVMTLQLTRLSELLGAVQLPSPASAPPAPEPQGEDEGDGENATESENDDPADIEPETVIDEAPAGPSDGPSVDEAFGDLSG